MAFPCLSHWPPRHLLCTPGLSGVSSCCCLCSRHCLGGLVVWEHVSSHIQPCSPLLSHHLPDEVQAIATLIEKQAQIVVKPRMVSEEEKQRKAALLAQYADVTDEEEYPFWSLGAIP